jgi:EAL domain-containing protein (putative c-di-GMP-specific phosphodiesterase class I)
VGSLLVAEGVETDAELAVVRELGVPLVQGFLLARPALPWPTLGGRILEPAGEPQLSRMPGADAQADERQMSVL